MSETMDCLVGFVGGVLGLTIAAIAIIGLSIAIVLAIGQVLLLCGLEIGGA